MTKLYKLDEEVDIATLGFSLSIIYQSFKSMQGNSINSGIKNFSIMEQFKKLAEEAIRMQLDIQTH